MKSPMKISNETINILKNFSSINEGLKFSKGNVIRTVCPATNIIAEAKVGEEFPKDFSIYNLNTFLGLHSLFDNPDVVICDNFLTMGCNNKNVRYLFAEEGMVKAGGKVREGNSFVNFTLKSEDFTQLLRASDIFKIEHIVFSSEGAGAPIKVICENVKNPEDNFEVEIPESSCEKKFKVVHSRKNLLLMSGDYTVLCTDRFSKFEHTNGNLSYWIAIETGLSEV
jgi:hypothetical protein